MNLKIYKTGQGNGFDCKDLCLYTPRVCHMKYIVDDHDKICLIQEQIEEDLYGQWQQFDDFLDTFDFPRSMKSALQKYHDINQNTEFIGNIDDQKLFIETI